MTKTNFKVTNKLPVWLAIPAVIIIAGLVMFFLLGFNPSASIAENKSLLVTHDAYVNASEDLGKELQSVCASEIEKAGLTVLECKSAETTAGGQIEYVFSSEVGNDKLDEVWTNIETALAANVNLKAGNYDYSVHVNVSQQVYTYIWRAAISAGVALVLAFVYVAVRYRLSMGLATFIAGVLDLAVTLALTVILRIPVTTALATAAILAVTYSILTSLVSFNKMRSLLKSEEYATMSASDAVEAANAQAVKRVVILSVVTVVFYALFAIFGGAAFRAVAIPAILGVVASAFSGIFVKPSLVAAFKNAGEKMKANGAEKARLAKKQEEEERAQKRNAKN